MATKLNLKCAVCEATDSFMWRAIEGGPGNICQNCYEKTAKESEEESVTSSKAKSPEEKKLRKSTRILKKTKSSPVTVIGLGKGAIKSNKVKRIGQRRTFKTPAISITTKNVASVSHKGSTIRVGDIVSLMDAHDNLFYAQVRGLTVNMYCEKHAYITWLIPTKVSPPPNERFDASTYLIGHDEDTPRSLNLLEFVMHAPSNYYHDKTQPLPFEERPVGYTWTRFKRRPGSGRKAAETATTCTLTSATSQNVVTTTAATVTMPTPESLKETTAATAANSATTVTSTTTATTAAPAVSSTTTSEQ